jgi:hypothetical protein
MACPPAGDDFCINHGGTPAAKPAKEEKLATTASSARASARDDSPGWGIAAGILGGILAAGAMLWASVQLTTPATKVRS